jgi:hypothetical protein
MFVGRLVDDKAAGHTKTMTSCREEKKFPVIFKLVSTAHHITDVVPAVALSPGMRLNSRPTACV